jgi:hypothetical protein
MKKLLSIGMPAAGYLLLLTAIANQIFHFREDDIFTQQLKASGNYGKFMAVMCAIFGILCLVLVCVNWWFTRQHARWAKMATRELARMRSLRQSL